LRLNQPQLQQLLTPTLKHSSLISTQPSTHAVRGADISQFCNAVRADAEQFRFASFDLDFWPFIICAPAEGNSRTNSRFGKNRDYSVVAGGIFDPQCFSGTLAISPHNVNLDVIQHDQSVIINI
jgi:hypothetical protein